MLKNSTLLPQKPVFPPIGQSFTVLPTVDSTNNYAMAQVQKGLASHGSVFFALEQTAGRGQRGRQWQSTAGENIMMSVVVSPHPLLSHEQFVLSAIVALGCYDFFKMKAGPEDTRIKWPNDVYWQDRKAGGILIESVIGADSPAERTWKWAIAGIGININQGHFEEGTGRPVSLRQITGKTFDLLEIARECCRAIEKRFAEWREKGKEYVLEQYMAALYKRGEKVKLKRDNIVFETTILGITSDGRLLTSDRSFDHGEITWV